MWLKWKLSSFRDSANLDASKVHGLRRTYHWLGNRFWHTDGTLRWRGLVESPFSLESVLLSVQDRCTVCAKHTNCLEIILDTPDGTPRWWGSSETLVRLQLVPMLTQDRCTVCVKHTIGLEIILDAPDETPRWRRSCVISLFPFGDNVSVCAR
jgi:hypothetical protein